MAVQNFLEEEEYETPNLSANYNDSGAHTSEPEGPKFGEPGFNKGGPNRRKGTPRARATEVDDHYLLFLLSFTGATAEALSMIRERQETNMDTNAGGMPTIKATENRMRKLRKLGLVFSVTNRATGVTSYSLTPFGISHLADKGYEVEHGDTLEGKAPERVNHYKNIAQVAAMFIGGFFLDTLGIPPVRLDDLISERQMRGASAPFKAELKKLRDEKKPGDWAPRRLLELQRALKVASDQKSWPQMVRSNPMLLTLPLSDSAGKKFRGVYETDMAVILDDTRTGAAAKNWLVEVELSRKSEAAYHAIFKSLAKEFERPLTYSGAVFMVIGDLVANRLKKVNADGNYGLIESGKIKILPITHRDNTPLATAKRITIGGI